jgi:hypothetical protein
LDNAVPQPDPSGLLEQLNRNSTPYLDPLTRVDWDSLQRDSFWLPESALSLFGLPEYEDLPLERRQLLSRYEFINFVSAGLWLEGIFMERIGRSLRQAGRSIAELSYRLHELREESGHSLMFLELMQRSGLAIPPVHFHRLSVANLLGRLAPFSSAGFAMAVLMGEEIPDRMNRYVRLQRTEICPAIADIIRIHVIDEARHIAHARDRLDGLHPLPRWKAGLLRPVLSVALREFIAAFYYPAAHVYERAGLAPGRHWARLARRNPHRRRLIQENTRPTLRTLRHYGMALSI